MHLCLLSFSLLSILLLLLLWKSMSEASIMSLERTYSNITRKSCLLQRLILSFFFVIILFIQFYSFDLLTYNCLMSRRILLSHWCRHANLPLYFSRILLFPIFYLSLLHRRPLISRFVIILKTRMLSLYEKCIFWWFLLYISGFLSLWN